ncbi:MULTISPECIES: hypothetical protein [Bacillus]|uniref:hypothetical protein n=1 Tax=Bacillus TaxID=1386 RepID=UPI001642676B|nr:MULTISPECIES: hypothetical protein [Bacillus]MBS4747423.1 hypothetical protein [Bacillus altitudinis]MBS4749428.1 hypothetical protein [Bacillus altitudinis]
MIKTLKSKIKKEEELPAEYVTGFYSGVFYSNLMFMPLLFLMLFHMWGVINR